MILGQALIRKEYKMNNRIIKTLSIRPFLFLILAEIFSQFAINMLNFVLVIVAFTISNSSTAVSGVILSFTIPAMIFGIFAGAYVDRLNKKKVLYATNFVRAILVLLLVFTQSNLWYIYALSLAISFVSQFFIPAETPMIPVVVRRDLLLTANAIFGTVIYGSIFAAYALSGPLLLFFGRTGTFVILSASFLLAGVFAMLIKVKTNPKSERIKLARLKLDFSGELRSVISFFRKAKTIYSALFMLSLAQVLVMVLAVIGPGYAEQVLKIQVEKFPAFFVTPAVLGTAFGAILLGNYLHKHPRKNITKIGLFLMAISILLLPYGSKVESREFVQTLNTYLPHILEINILHIMVVLAFLLGIANSFIFVPSNTILQEETLEDFRGKAYGLLNTMIGFLSLIPIILVGGLADLIGTKSVILVIGVVVLLIAIYNSVSRKDGAK